MPPSLQSLTLDSTGLTGGFSDVATLPAGLKTFRLLGNTVMSSPFSSRLLTLNLQTLCATPHPSTLTPRRVLVRQGLVGSAFMSAIASSATLPRSLIALSAAPI